jgi:hypothetical protein
MSPSKFWDKTTDVIVIYKTDLDWIYCTLYIHAVLNYRQLQRYRYSTHTLLFTVTHAIEFSVVTSRILATDFSQSHCHFKLHVKSSCHSLIRLLPFFCNCQFRRLYSVQLLCSQARTLEGWRLETLLSTLDFCSILPNISYNNFVRTTQKIVFIVD